MSFRLLSSVRSSFRRISYPRVRVVETPNTLILKSFSRPHYLSPIRSMSRLPDKNKNDANDKKNDKKSDPKKDNSSKLDEKSEKKSKKTDLFAKGDNYASFRPTYPKSLFEEVVSYANKTKQHDGSTLAVDVGSGTGQATIELAAYYDKVIGVEGSQSQRNSAKSHHKITYTDGTAEHLPHSINDHSVDLLIVAQAFHWFDAPKFYSEVDRVLRPGGTLAIWSYSMAELDHKQANELLQHFHFKTMGPYWDEKRSLVDNHYKDVVLPEAYLRPIRTFRSMGKEMSLTNLINYVGTWSCLKTYKEREPKKPDPRIALQEALLKAYGSNDPDKVNVSLTHQIVLLLAQKPSD